MRKFLENHGLKPHKITVLSSVTFVTFQNDEDRNEALIKLKDVFWKKQKLVVRIAKAKEDPLAAAKETQNKEPLTREEFEIQLKDSVIPFWRLNYNPDQLQLKKDKVLQTLANIRVQTLKSNTLLAPLIDSVTAVDSSAKPLVCPCADIVPSPVLDHYRNKCEFTVGADYNGNEPKIGFRLGKYKAGKLTVGLPESIQIVPQNTLNIVNKLQQLFDAEIGDSNGRLAFTRAYNPRDNAGHWRMVLVRQTLSNETLVLVDLCPKDLSEDKLTLIRQILKCWLESNPQLNVTSFFFNLRVNSADPLNPELLSGQPQITEICCGLQFKISPNSFFQVNTKATELLYDQIKSSALDLVDNCDRGKVVLLDVCCGTGTIGLCLAKYFDKVIGIELIPEAVEDALENAKFNQINNADFFAGKAEDLVQNVIRTVPSTHKVVAVLDPPRCGVHSSVINTLRKCQAVKGIVFVSCDISAASQNFVTLSQLPSNKIGGDPFYPVMAQPFDLFPQTNHVEVVISYRRVPQQLLE
ncbi:tRNA methyltransferase 2 [Cichlidogyrus casuarinus]|uniref:tRNA (uracil(54)-C(5))-methyltransferase n=1 Tax=Cichlidogyrus casuarinus TaxID=1844966 RepID=A0ABD2PYQ6_9PLAT